MPVYTYRCIECNKVIEVSQRMIEDAFRVHSEADIKSECKGEIVRQLHASFIQFKGTGFYETDYKNKDKEKPKKKSSEPLKAMEPTVTKKGESES